MLSETDSIVASAITRREAHILWLLGQGKTTKEMASLLGLSVTTIGSYRRELCRKLNVHSTAELVAHGARHAPRPPA
jgi:DNA-binding CsgD family transcriptional regulator